MTNAHAVAANSFTVAQLNEARAGLLADANLVDAFMKATGKSREAVEAAVERVRKMSDAELVQASSVDVGNEKPHSGSRLKIDASESDHLKAGLGIFVPVVLAFAAGYAVGTMIYKAL